MSDSILGYSDMGCGGTVLWHLGILTGILITRLNDCPAQCLSVCGFMVVCFFF